MASLYTRLCSDPVFVPEPNVAGKRDQSRIFSELGIQDVAALWDPEKVIPQPTWTFPSQPGEPQFPRVAVRRFSRERWGALSHYAKAAGVTINDLILTAYFRAMYAIVYPLPQGEQKEILVTVDLRRYLPDRRAEAICNLSGAVGVKIPSMARESFLQTLSRVSEVMREHKRNRPGLSTAVAFELLSYNSFRNALGRLLAIKQQEAETRQALLVLSNFGVICPGPIRFSHNVARDAYMVGPAACAPGFMLAASSYNDVLTLTVSYYESTTRPRDVEQVLNLVLDDLISCGSSGERGVTMEEAQFSLTALMTAYCRAYHAMHDALKIFDDFLAYPFIPERARLIYDHNLARALQLFDPIRAASCPDQATALALVMQAMPTPPITLSRSRYTEDNLIKAVGQGVRQYVIPGAGMDTFAFRRPEMVEQLLVFEVDHPATQAFKLRRLSEVGWEHPAQLHFVPVDFTQDSLAEALTRSSYDPQAPSFFSWLGVTYYLTRDAVFATLRTIADIAPAGSSVIFDYLETDAFIPGRVSKRVQGMMESLRQIGEPMKAGFNPSTLATDLAPLGLRLHENLSPTDIEERYFQGRSDGYHACEHVHLAWAVVV